MSRVSKFSENRGVAYVELAIILPFLLLLFLGAFELTSRLRTDRLLLNISVEVAKQFYEVLGKERTDADIPKQVSNRLLQYLNTTRASSPPDVGTVAGDLRASLLPEAEVKIQIYRFTSGGGLPALIDSAETSGYLPGWSQVNATTVNSFLSKQTATSAQIRSLSLNTRIVVVESAVVRNSLFAFFLGDAVIREIAIV